MVGLKFRRIAVLFAALVLLGACAETQLVFHTAKRIGKSVDDAPQKSGAYKIGNPYKIKGIWYYPAVNYQYDKTGIASWYGPGFHGKKTANGEIYDQNALTAAHKTLPIPTFIQVTNLENGRSMKLRINDRGPYAHGRIIDLSRRSAQMLGVFRKGTARVRVRVLADESRHLAQTLIGQATMAKIGTPIRRDINVAKPSVASNTLPPPSGTRNATPAPQYTSRKAVVASRATVTDLPIAPDGVVSVTPISKTKMFVQAGSFTRYDNANRVATRLYGFKDVKITSYRANGREYFRVRAGPIKTVGEADNVLNYVINTGYSNARIVVD